MRCDLNARIIHSSVTNVDGVHADVLDDGLKETEFGLKAFETRVRDETVIPLRAGIRVCARTAIHACIAQSIRATPSLPLVCLPLSSS